MRPAAGHAHAPFDDERRVAARQHVALVAQVRLRGGPASKKISASEKKKKIYIENEKAKTKKKSGPEVRRASNMAHQLLEADHARL